MKPSLSYALWALLVGATVVYSVVHVILSVDVMTATDWRIFWTVSLAAIVIFSVSFALPFILGSGRVATGRRWEASAHLELGDGLRLPVRIAATRRGVAYSSSQGSGFQTWRSPVELQSGSSENATFIDLADGDRLVRLWLDSERGSLARQLRHVVRHVKTHPK